MIKKILIFRWLMMFCLVFLPCFVNGTETLEYQENYSSHIEIGNHVFRAEVANTPQLLQKGMMFRPHMQEDQAMIFVFPRPKKATFWMKNTLISLDILFFDEAGKLLEIKHRIPPCKTQRCEVYPSQSNRIKFVVEIKAGVASALGIMLGDKVNGCGF